MDNQNNQVTKKSLMQKIKEQPVKAIVSIAAGLTAIALTATFITVVVRNGNGYEQVENPSQGYVQQTENPNDVTLVTEPITTTQPETTFRFNSHLDRVSGYDCVTGMRPMANNALEHFRRTLDAYQTGDGNMRANMQASMDNILFQHLHESVRNNSRYRESVRQMVRDIIRTGDMSIIPTLAEFQAAQQQTEAARAQ